MMRALLAALLVVIAAAASRPALAQDYEQLLAVGTAMRWQSQNPWKVNLAAGIGVAGTYQYSRDDQVVALPLVDVEWRERFFFSTQRGIGYNWIRAERTVAGPRITFDLGRQRGDDAFLDNTEDIDPTAELGFFWIRYSGPWRFNADIKYGLGGHKGVRGAVGVAYGSQLSDNSSLFVGAEAHYASKKYNFAYFGASDHGINDVTPYLSLVRALRGGAYIGVDGRFSFVVGPADTTNLSAAYGHSASFLIGRRF
jgi:outer membrane scaffolding protein for murein synthesis (MipA/OmpV family)